MGFTQGELNILRERAEASDRRSITQPLRPAVDVPAGIRLAHVKQIAAANLDGHYVPVQLIRRTRTDPWDGTWEYWGEIEDAVCLPPLKAWWYQPFEYAGAEWQADIPVVTLSRYDGAWIVMPPADATGIGITGPWACSYDNYNPVANLLFEIHPETLCMKPGRFVLSPGGGPDGMGGDRAVIWHLDSSTRKIYKMRPAGMCVERETSTPGWIPRDCGGTADALWVTTWEQGTNGNIYRLDPETFDTLPGFPKPIPSAGFGEPQGIGGDTEGAWFVCLGGEYRAIYRLQPDGTWNPQDFWLPPDNRTPSSIGGTATTVYYASVDTAAPTAASIVYRLDPESPRGQPMRILASRVYPRLNIRGIGG